MTTVQILNVRRLIDELGGPSTVASILGCSRGSPYIWQRRGWINTKVLSDIVRHASAFIAKEKSKPFISKNGQVTLDLVRYTRGNPI